LKRKTAWLAAISRDNLDENHMEKYLICSKHFHSGKPAKPFDHTNVDWVPTLHLGHEKQRQQSSEAIQSQVQRADRAKKRNEKRLEEEKEQQMFCEVTSAVSSDMVNETVAEIVSEIGHDIFEWFDMDTAAVDKVIDRLIHEQCLLSVKDIAMNEVRSAMLSYADGHCKCTSEVVKLKRERVKEVP